MLDAQRQKAIDRVRGDVTSTYGARLLCLALYGSAVDDDYVPGKSDLNFAVVLDRIGIDDLRKLRGLLPSWHGLAVGTPLLIERDFLQHARDVFPIELEDIRAGHLLLAGDDLFTDLQIAAADLRRELEREARAKLLRLRVLCAESSGSREDIEGLMVESVKSFVAIMRAILRLLGDDPPMRLLPAIERFEEARGRRLPTIRHIAQVKLGSATWADDADAQFAAYLAEVEAVVAIVDKL